MTVLAEKMLVLGVDGMDPRLAKKLMDEGKMPNLKQYVQRGAAREDLRMLGAIPTITPPMWTTLASGAYPNTHGITCFWNQHPEKLDTVIYALDSRSCQAELLWNVLVEADKKTLVWHWPGSSWPPTSDNPKLHVVDGTQPARINAGVAGIDWEKYIIARKDIPELIYKPKAGDDTGAGCILTDVTVADEKSTSMIANLNPNNRESLNIELSHEDGDMAINKIPFDLINSPLKPAKGWANAPEGSLEFVALTSGGLTRRPCLVLQNEQGDFAIVHMYRSKKDQEPMLVLKKGVMHFNVMDDILSKDQVKFGNRNIQLMDIAADGSEVRLWMSGAADSANDQVWHPKSIFKDVVTNVGLVPVGSQTGGKYPDLVKRLVLPCWDNYCKWQAGAINHLINSQGYDVVFSHIHNVDAMGHFFWHYAKDRAEIGNDGATYRQLLEDVYVQTDNYLGEFLHLLDKEWTILIVSDHGLICSEEDEENIPLLGDPFGVNAIVMQELGYTILEKDAAGNNLRKIDWEKTRAVATRGNHIWINLKGKYPTGIVEAKDKYELETEIISALYNYRLNGKRVVNIALRNQDAELLGMNGPECGDIIYWLEEGFNRVHGDSLSTTLGYADTSVAPIFIAAGKGIKQGFITKRVIRQADFAPTMAVLAGVRMPAHCEGAPIYQILDK